MPFVTQEMMENGHITVEVIEAQSTWFGVTYYDDKKEAVRTLAELTEARRLPDPPYGVETLNFQPLNRLISIRKNRGLNHKFSQTRWRLIVRHILHCGSLADSTQ